MDDSDDTDDSMSIGSDDGQIINWNLKVMAARHLENRGHAGFENGGRVILPQRALDDLSSNTSVFARPIMFKVTNGTNQRSIHCGVLEFIAEEGICYMPTWMMNILGVNDQDLVHFNRVILPTATFLKLQPQSVDFLEISNLKAILENNLRRFACLTVGDIFAIQYNNRLYKLRVQEALPTEAVSVVECDMKVEFDDPLVCQPPSEESNEKNISGEKNSNVKETGRRLNGKSIDPADRTWKNGSQSHRPDENWQIGKLKFERVRKG